MAVKDQFKFMKENWLVLVIFLLIIILITASGNIITLFSGATYSTMEKMSTNDMYQPGYSRGGYEQDFAPDVDERKVTTNARLSIESKRNEFYDNVDKIKSIVESSDSYLLNEDLNTYGKGIGEYHNGIYTIKVEAGKYDDVISQLKDIGKVDSFSESKDDITGSYYNIKDELVAERERLKRLEALYNSPKTNTEGKIELTNKIFDVEKRIKYLEERLENKDKSIEYNTVYLTLNEKRSGFADMALVKLSTIIKTMLNSFNTLLVVIAAILPWAIIIYLIRLGYKIVKK